MGTPATILVQLRAMFHLLFLCVGAFTHALRSRRYLLLENLALGVLKRRRPRVVLSRFDKLFWIFAHRFWSPWKQALIVVTPETVFRWHRTGFRFYWRLISRVRKPAGRRTVSKEVQDLIFRMVAENPTWGAPRIHGELLMLGFDVSERTISRWMRRAPRDPEPAKRWLAFLRNHHTARMFCDIELQDAAAIVANDNEAVEQAERDRGDGEEIHCGNRFSWIVQQLREAFPFEPAPQFLIFDRDAKYGLEVPFRSRSLK
jgi:putative transposase